MESESLQLVPPELVQPMQETLALFGVSNADFQGMVSAKGLQISYEFDPAPDWGKESAVVVSEDRILLRSDTNAAQEEFTHLLQLVVNDKLRQEKLMLLNVDKRIHLETSGGGVSAYSYILGRTEGVPATVNQKQKEALNQFNAANPEFNFNGSGDLFTRDDVYSNPKLRELSALLQGIESRALLSRQVQIPEDALEELERYMSDAGMRGGILAMFPQTILKTTDAAQDIVVANIRSEDFAAGADISSIGMMEYESRYHIRSIMMHLGFGEWAMLSSSDISGEEEEIYQRRRADFEAGKAKLLGSEKRPLTGPEEEQIVYQIAETEGKEMIALMYLREEIRRRQAVMFESVVKALENKEFEVSTIPALGYPMELEKFGLVPRIKEVLDKIGSAEKTEFLMKILNAESIPAQSAVIAGYEEQA